MRRLTSQDVRKDMEDRHGKENVKSTTVPPPNMPNVILADKEKVVQIPVEKKEWDDKKKDFVTKTEFENVKVVFDKKGYPILDDITKDDTRLPIKEFRKASYQKQMEMATKDLGERIKKGEINKNQFTADELKDIENGSKKIGKNTWHHHQDTGRMQLVPTNIHDKVKHVGWDSMSEGK